MSLVVEQAGALASIQDRGRFGVRHLGVTQGGAVDWLSCAWANWLLGNPLAAPVVEVTLGNFRLRAETDARLAICGADLGATLDGQPIAPGHAFTISWGQLLTFSQPRHGVRAYLAAPGGFQAPRVLGSCATVGREQMGGLADDGRPLMLAGPGCRLEGTASTSDNGAVRRCPFSGARGTDRRLQRDEPVRGIQWRLGRRSACRSNGRPLARPDASLQGCIDGFRGDSAGRDSGPGRRSADHPAQRPPDNRRLPSARRTDTLCCGAVGAVSARQRDPPQTCLAGGCAARATVATQPMALGSTRQTGHAISARRAASRATLRTARARR